MMMAFSFYLINLIFVFVTLWKETDGRLFFRKKAADQYKYVDQSLHNNSVESIVGSTGKNIARTLKASRHVKHALKGIAVGTRWCGNGNVAKHFDDLGEFRETDMCCREHDLCVENIPATQYSPKFNLTNDGLYTRSRCSCDGTFYNCLKNAKNIHSTKIGKIYFNRLAPKCFERTYDVIKCAKVEKKRCVVHYFDANTKKGYHWFDNPAFCSMCTYPIYDTYQGVLSFSSNDTKNLTLVRLNNLLPVINSKTPIWKIIFEKIKTSLFGRK